MSQLYRSRRRRPPGKCGIPTAAILGSAALMAAALGPKHAAADPGGGEPPIFDTTAVTIVEGDGTSFSLDQTQPLRATILDLDLGAPVHGPDRGEVTFYAGNYAVGADADPDGDGIFEVDFAPGCTYPVVGLLDLQVVYAGAHLAAPDVSLLPSAAQGTLSLAPAACCPSPEICDGEDNDCNGLIDDGFEVGAPCSLGVGACARKGSIQCDVAFGSTCDAIPGTPAAEVCGDAIDSDCDGNDNNGCGCIADAACGATGSGVICDDGSSGTFTCVLGCRGIGGNGCGAGLHCTSHTEAAGACVACLSDEDCGGPGSGVVCEAQACQAGCRGEGGNGCPTGLTCSATGSEFGTCSVAGSSSSSSSSSSTSSSSSSGIEPSDAGAPIGLSDAGATVGLGDGGLGSAGAGGAGGAGGEAGHGGEAGDTGVVVMVVEDGGDRSGVTGTNGALSCAARPGGEGSALGWMLSALLAFGLPGLRRASRRAR